MMAAAVTITVIIIIAVIAPSALGGVRVAWEILHGSSEEIERCLRVGPSHRSA